MYGRIISLEGIDGAGKSSHVKTVWGWLRDHGHKAHCMREPGGTKIGEGIRDLLLNSDMDRHTELFLFQAARRQLLTEKVLPLLRRGEWVILDRYIDSTYAYQHGGLELPESLITHFEESLPEGAVPFLSIMIDVSMETAKERMQASGKGNRFDAQPIFQKLKIRDAYHRRFKSGGERFATVNGDGTYEEVEEEIKSVLLNHFAKRL